MSAPSTNTAFLDEINNIVGKIAGQKVDESVRSLAEFRLKYNELEILDEIDASMAEMYVEGHGVIDRFMENPKLAIEYFRMSVMEMLDVEMTNVPSTAMKQVFGSCIIRLVFAMAAADNTERITKVQKEVEKEPRAQRKRPAAAEPIFAVNPLPSTEARLSDFLSRLSPEERAAYDQAQRARPPQGNMQRDYEVGPDPIDYIERNANLTELGKEFDRVAGTPDFPAEMAPEFPDDRLSTLPLDENFNSYPALGEPDALIPDNPNKKPSIIMPDAQEVKQYAAPSSRKLPDVDDDGLGKGSGRRPAQRRRSSAKEGQPDQG